MSAGFADEPELDRDRHVPAEDMERIGPEAVSAPVSPRESSASDDKARDSASSPDPLVLPQNEFELVQAVDLVRTVAPFLIAQRLRIAETRLLTLRVMCDSIAAEVPEGEPATVAVSRVLKIISSEERTDHQ